MKIFIAGPRVISRLSKAVEDRLRGICEHNYTVLVGDAGGVDKAVQIFFSGCGYPNVIVYASNGKVRNNLGNWQVEAVPVPPDITGFEFYAAKDRAMADDADYGFMVWNGESKGTLNNIINLLNGCKEVLVFFTPKNSLIRIKSVATLEALLLDCNDNTRNLYAKLYRSQTATQMQLSLF